MILKQHSILPGFGLALGFTLFYLSFIVLIPLSALFLKTATLDWSAFWEIVTAPRVLASYRLSLGASLIAALLNAVFGLLVAWVLVRYSFPGKRVVDALVDLPFALPTAVAGIALTALYAGNGWIGQYLEPLRDQGGLYAAGRRRGADLHRPALRGAHGAAGAGGPRSGVRGGGGHVGREPAGRPSAG
ncbi:MAG: hypothetical protein MPW15_24400 [Candidatus Manganitrophus sp.]|nr:hypothetical protein [Candidatus Manganitrophus sp.]